MCRVIRNGKKIDLGRPGRRLGYWAEAGTDTLFITKSGLTGSWFGYWGGDQKTVLSEISSTRRTVALLGGVLP